MREVAFGRFLAIARVTAAWRLEGWSEPTKAAFVEHHVLAIQDMRKIGKGVGRGVLPLSLTPARLNVSGRPHPEGQRRDGSPMRLDRWCDVA